MEQHDEDGYVSDETPVSITMTARDWKHVHNGLQGFYAWACPSVSVDEAAAVGDAAEAFASGHHLFRILAERIDLNLMES